MTLDKHTNSSTPGQHTPVVAQFDTPTEPKRLSFQQGANEAANLIRQKITHLYAKEPNAQLEASEARLARPRSTHQQYMYDLSMSGKSLADIQTAWHNYYVALPNEEKHRVWQEFYEANSRTQYTQQLRMATSSQAIRQAQQHEETVAAKHAALPTPRQHQRQRVLPKIADTKRQIVQKVQANEAKSRARQRVESLLFGLATGAVVLVIFLFGFFNEFVIAPLIQPSRSASATPVIFTSDTVAASGAPQVVIPKINVQIPVDYNLQSSDETTVQTALENGVIHYPSTVKPGQKGNTALFGHSSNNIFNKGKYKFAFVLLHELIPGDIFYLTYNGTVYAYKVYDKKSVYPSEVTVLNNIADKPATATLITCDPPGTTLKRLVVWGEQISPSPTSNSTADTASITKSAPVQLSSNGPTAWTRFWRWVNPLD